MDVLLSVLIVIIISSLVTIIMFKLSKKQYPKLSKYIPAIASAVGALCLYVKLELNLYTHAFSGIYDILGIIILSIVFGISIIVALSMELNQKLKSGI
ncbi:MAG: hypothetical protein LPK00_12600 [Bacillaceae bacterium]|nr:hypothetical protein [Bacillaceae bacterium]